MFQNIKDGRKPYLNPISKNDISMSWVLYLESLVVLQGFGMLVSWSSYKLGLTIKYNKVNPFYRIGRVLILDLISMLSSTLNHGIVTLI